MGLVECNQVQSRHFSPSLFLRSFKLGAAIRGVNVIYYAELRMESRNTVELRVRTQEKYGGDPQL
jgi:hypothetical protein